MPRRDMIHDAVRNALIKAGWKITHDPFTIKRGRVKLYADLAAERTLAAERNGEKIVVEIKTLAGQSLLNEVENAAGQYVIYLGYLRRVAPEYHLYLAISDIIYDKIGKLDDLTEVLQETEISLLVVNPETEEIVKWIR